MDPSTLAWLLRVQETEEVYRKRVASLQAREVEMERLERELGQLRDAELRLRVKLLEHQERLAHAKHQCITTAEQAATAQRQLECRQSMQKMRTLRAVAEQQLHSLTASMQAESGRMAKFEASLAGAQEGPVAEAAELQRTCHSMQTQLERADAQLLKMRPKLSTSALDTQAQELKASVERLSSGHKDAESQLADVKAQRQRAEAQISEAQAHQRALQLKEHLDSVRQERDQLRAEQDRLDTRAKQLRAALGRG